jgi:hypothetical protein
MTRLAFLPGLAWAALSLACGPTEVVVDGGPGADAGGPTGRLTVESEPSLALTFGEEARLRVRYTEEERPVAGVSIRFALEGAAHDATVSDLILTTGPEGVVETTVVAGTVSSAFRVRASAARAAPAYVNVSVSNRGFGPLEVRAVYDGRRTEAGRRVISVYSETACDRPEGLPTFPDRMVTLDDPEIESVRWGALPAGLHYAVVGRVEGPTGATLATACKDGIEVARDVETRVELRFDDAPLDPEGRYDTTLELRPAASVGAATERALDGGVGVATDPAALYLDALEAELRDRGEAAAADALAAERAGGVPESELALRLEDAGEGPSVALSRYVAALSARLSVVRLGGPLDVGRGESALYGSFAVERLEVGPAGGDPDAPAPLVLDPGAVALDFEPELTLGWGASADLMRVEPLELRLPLGTLVAATVEAEAAEVAAPGELLVDGAGCDALAGWVEASGTVGPVCDRACADAACRRALGTVLEAAKSTATTLDEPRDRIALEGSVVLRDDDDDLRADGFEGRGLGGVWTGPVALEGDPLSADLLGERE